ncbi:MAG: hypothetical protein H8E66_19650 [Planctomycetes bacterium]|nr:hypothetical protein [Planctomycetota bacterium]
MAHHRLMIAFAGLVFSLAFPLSSHVAAEDAISWRSGEDFRRQLDSTIGFQWESSPIRQGLLGLGANQRIALWLDRRVDPGHEVDLLVSDATLDEALQRVGNAIGGGVCYVGSVTYIGSTPVTTKLATLAAMRRDEVKQLPTTARIRFAESSAWKWEELSTPGELLGELAEAANTRVVNIDQIQHDLWPAGDWPAMPVTDRMTLLLAGFDLTFEISRDGSAIRLAPMPADVAIERSYSPRGSLNTAATAIAKALPSVGVKKQGAQLAITGTFEEHEVVGRLIRGEPIRRAESKPGSKRFDLRVENQPIGAIVKVVADREMLEVRVDSAIRSKLQRRISLDVKQLTLEELLERALGSEGIAHKVEGSVLELRAP